MGSKLAIRWEKLECAIFATLISLPSWRMLVAGWRLMGRGAVNILRMSGACDSYRRVRHSEGLPIVCILSTHAY